MLQCQTISVIEERGRILIYRDEDSESRKEIVQTLQGRNSVILELRVGEGEIYLWKELKMSHQYVIATLRVGTDL